jgi:hypothetical protein
MVMKNWKIVLASILALLCIAADAATELPVQLISPAGSTSGQAIVSTGATSAPGWSNSFTITGGSITGVPISGSTGSFTTVTASSTITPSQTAGIVGTTTNNAANAGSVGEFVTATGTGISMSSATPTNMTSVSLTAGDWDVLGNVEFDGAGGAVMNSAQAGVNSTSATLPGLPAKGVLTTAATPNSSNSVAAPVIRFSLASTTTIFLVGQTGFSTGTVTGTGFIRARRVR